MDPLAFYLDNSALTEIDFQNPRQGNPGVGATEFMTVLVASELSKRDANVTLLTTKPGKFPTYLKVNQVENLDQAIEFSIKNKAILTIRAHIFGFDKILLKVKSHENLRIVIWAHLTPNHESLKSIAKTSQVISVVCLENNQRVRMGDSLAHPKLKTIPYGITGNTRLVSVANNSNLVVYTGALVPQKGFHLLADAWPSVVREIPDAKLYVIGSGQLYDSNISLGPKSIASVDYEKRIFRKLANDDQSVHFLGKTNSTDRNYIIEECRLGIVNPSARTETFCLSAVEFEQRGIPVIGGRKYGLLDTVKHKKTGYLVLNGSNLDKHIIRVLKDDKKIAEMGLLAQEFVLGKYNLSKIIDQWSNLFDSLSTGSTIPLKKKTSKMKVKSMQAIFVTTNRYLVSATNGSWPTGLAMWEAIKQMRLNLLNFLNIKNGRL